MLKTTQAKQSNSVRDIARSLVQNRKASEAPKDGYFEAEAPTCEMPGRYKQGDWVLYKGKPRQVYTFHPFGPTEEYPAIIRDPRFDEIEVMGIKKRLKVSDVQRMTVEAVTI